MKPGEVRDIGSVCCWGVGEVWNDEIPPRPDARQKSQTNPRESGILVAGLG